MNSPIVGDELGALSKFAVVADERSFTKAAVKLGVSRSAVSHSVRALEERLGLRLLARTTRSVAPTDAGERLLEQLRPALSGIAAALSDVGRLRDIPAGVVRLIAPPIVSRCSAPSWRSSPVTTPTSLSTSPAKTTPEATWSRAASTPAFTSASSSNATWSRSG
jgi:hypothetical protein